METVSFNELGLSKESLSAVEDMGYKVPTEIQSKAIPYILQGRDVIGHSKTGTGKTMAFGLPAIELVDKSIRTTQVLVLCPTRELAEQAAREIRKAATHKRISVTAVYGGASMEMQTRDLRRGSQIVIGTPGRIMDHMRRGNLKLQNLEMLVLDEADEMLNMGFRDDIETILTDVSEDRITVLFSATMSKEILHITKNYQRDAKLIKVIDKNLTVASIDQWYVYVKKPNKALALDILLKYHQPKLTLVFCNTKRQVDELIEKLQKAGQAAVALHGDMNQGARNRVMHGFRSGTMPILVATDVAARGIDVDDVELVVNFDIPQDDEYYVHRIGRTGRAGKNGSAVTFVSGNIQLTRLKKIERYIKTKIPQRPLPSRKEIEKMQHDSFADGLQEELAKESSGKFERVLARIIEQGYSAEQVATTLIRMELEKNQLPEEIVNERAPKKRHASGEMLRFFVSVGRKDKVSPSDIVGCITRNARINGDSIGKIDIYEKFSFVEMLEQCKDQVIRAFSDNEILIRKRRVSIEVAKSR